MSTPSPDVQNAVNAAAEAINGNHHHETAAMVVADPKAEENNDLMTGVITVAAVGVGVALIEAALIPGMLIGVAAVVAPKFFPKMTDGLRPMMKSTMRGMFTLGHKTREMMSEASEHVQDLMAEARAESQAPAAAPTPAPAAAPAPAPQA